MSNLASALLGVLAFAGGTAQAQGTVLSPGEVVRRDALVQPGLDDLKKGDPVGALSVLQPALLEFPRDEKVLMLSAEAAMESRQNEAAVQFFRRTLAEKPVDEWQIRFGLMIAEARLGRWPEFDADLAVLKAAKKSGSAQLTAAGFVVDEFEAGGQKVSVAYYPLLAGKYHTLYRFLLSKPARLDGSVSSSASGDRCKDPKFSPYLDLESDDVDQAMHPELAAKGDRVYSLDSYPAACSQALIQFYMGEPKYEDLRAAVLKVLEKPARE